MPVVWPEVTTDSNPSAAASAPAPAAPVLSLRRVPAFLARLAAERRLRRRPRRGLRRSGVRRRERTRLPRRPRRPGPAAVRASARSSRCCRRPPSSCSPRRPCSTASGRTPASRPRCAPSVHHRAGSSTAISGSSVGGDPLLATDEFAAQAGVSGPAPARVAPGGPGRPHRGEPVCARCGVACWATRAVTTRCGTCRRGSPSTSTRASRARSARSTLNSGFVRLRPTPVAASAPATAAAAALAVLLGRRGVRVAAAGEGAAPVDGVVVTTLESLPIAPGRGRDVAAERQHDRRVADQGAGLPFRREREHRGGARGHPRRAVRCARARRPATITLADGSGLDRVEPGDVRRTRRAARPRRRRTRAPTGACRSPRRAAR